MRRALLPNVDARAPGLTPDELARRVQIRETQPIRPRALRRWLLAEALAVELDGRLVATERGVELGAGLQD
jgi:hypothetical protein